MKKIHGLKTILFTLPLLLPVAVNADPYSEGYDLAMAGNYTLAYDKWLPLAMGGDGRAQFNLALMYHGGLHVNYNEDMALYWYNAAAENGIPEAQEYMYIGYKEGWFGLPRAEGQASYWAGKLDKNTL